jgi:hypothetical protein
MRLLIEAALMVMWRSSGNRGFWSLVSARPKTYIYILYILVFSGSVSRALGKPSAIMEAMAK